MSTILGVRIDNLTKKEALAHCQRWLIGTDTAATATETTGAKFVVTPNPEILVYATHHPNIRAILNQADLVLADGSGVVWLAKPKLPERVTGTDIMFDLLSFAELQHIAVGFVLRPDGLSTKQQLADTLQHRWPALQYQIIFPTEQIVGGTYTSDPEPKPGLDAPILVFVALGCPAQENWWVQHRTKLPLATRLVITVGGGVDFLTGQAKRAPSFFRKIGLEWLWRLALQPHRWRRILTATIVFPWYVFIRTSKSR